MKRFLVALAVLAVCAFLFAQKSAEGVLNLEFLNARTGEAVKPDRILLNGREQQAGYVAGGVVSMRLPNGQHELHIEAKGYLPLVATVMIDGDMTMTNTFELDPQSGMEDQSVEVDPASAILAGHVIDAVTGTAISDVEVAVPDHQATTRTDSKGRFVLSVEVPDATTGSVVGLNVKLVLSHDGYMTEERRNVEILTGNQKEASYRLEPISHDAEVRQKVTDERSEEEHQNNAPLFSWVYDISFD